MNATENTVAPSLEFFSSTPIKCEEKTISNLDFRRYFGEYRALNRNDFCYIPAHIQPFWEGIIDRSLFGFSKRLGKSHLFVLTEKNGPSIWARIIRIHGSGVVSPQLWHSRPLMLPQIDLKGRVSMMEAENIGRIWWDRDADVLTWTICTDVAVAEAIYVCWRMTYSVWESEAKLLKIDGLKGRRGRKRDEWDLLWQEGHWTEAGRALQAIRR